MPKRFHAPRRKKSAPTSPPSEHRVSAALLSLLFALFRQYHFNFIEFCTELKKPSPLGVATLIDLFVNYFAVSHRIASESFPQYSQERDTERDTERDKDGDNDRDKKNYHYRLTSALSLYSLGDL